MFFSLFFQSSFSIIFSLTPLSSSCIFTLIFRSLFFLILSFLFLSVLKGVLFSLPCFQFCFYFCHSLKKNFTFPISANLGFKFHVLPLFPWALSLCSILCMCFYCFINFLKIHGTIFSHVFCFCTMAIFFWQIPFAVIFLVLFLVFMQYFK